MPIDGHAYLVKQGWSGKGSGLRHGAIVRPVTVAQKKTLSGVGKDRDEAFPFWDHVFEAAAINIQVKLHNDDSDSDSADTPELVAELQRTKTGIISNRRPKTGTSALSGTVTPSSAASGSSTPRLSVMAAAKQEAARRVLYASFFRGPIIGFNDDVALQAETQVDTEIRSKYAEPSAAAGETKEKKEKKKRKRESSPVPLEAVGTESKEDKAERKRREREQKQAGASCGADAETVTPARDSEAQDEKTEKRRLKEERRIQKAERRARKAERRARKEEHRRLKELKKTQEQQFEEDAQQTSQERGRSQDSLKATSDPPSKQPTEAARHTKRKREKASEDD